MFVVSSLAVFLEYRASPDIMGGIHTTGASNGRLDKDDDHANVDVVDFEHHRRSPGFRPVT